MSDLRKLVILHTNDIHSHFEQMPKIASFIDRRREAEGSDRLLVLDIGDHMDRMRMETEGTEGAVNVAVLNETGYDAVTLGNNEGLTFSSEVLAETYAGARFAAVCGNLPLAGTGELPSWLAPCRIVEKSGIRIGLIGVTAYFTEYYRLLGWDIREPFATVAELARELRPQVDVLIVMSHLGLKNDERMAEQIEGIDIILGGHTHHLLETPRLVRRTYIGAAGKYGRYVGVMELEFDMELRRISALSGCCRDIADYPPAPRIVSLIEAYGEAAMRKLSRSVATLQEPLGIDWHGESALGNLLAAGIRAWVGAEIGLVNAGQLLGGLDAGSVSEAELLRICPSPINTCRMRLRGDLILQSLEESLVPEYQDKQLLGFGFRGKILGTLCVDGMRIEYDPQAPDYRKIRSVTVGSGLLERDREYDVATIDMFTFGVGYLSLREGKDIRFFLPYFLRDVLERELQDPEAIASSRVARWHRV
ncbi:bifunctional metallophosphatase/5'-nucleotidase [Paenibacillus hamazuiensis]|uniref:bifunctional metallophosphatase/5'-nucleotidase n=1 Tax=Paenibacillus hamazuiensis TaxID=2936508 RepID=UPI00200DD08D|nr:bifunctional UDP-sugar hydrolase/5'-nucleotidase [Paenibacillus hamazuiensis]